MGDINKDNYFPLQWFRGRHICLPVKELHGDGLPSSSRKN